MFCVVCNNEHEICNFCKEKQNRYIRFSEQLTTNKLTENIVLQCCDNCHLTEQDKEMKSGSSLKYITYCWKNKYLLDAPYNVIYPSWIKSGILTLLLIMKRSIDNKESTINFIPKEIWITIFKSINLNQIGRINPNHSSLFMENYNKASQLTYCELCKQFHYLDEGNILTVIEKYKHNQSLLYKIIFVMIYSDRNKYFCSFHKLELHERVFIKINLSNPILRKIILTNNFNIIYLRDLSLLMKQYRDDIVRYVNQHN